MANSMKPGVCIDLGASSTRVTGQDSSIYFLPNTLVFLDKSDVVDLEKSDVTVHDEPTFLANMDITIEKTAGGFSPAFPARALIGDLAHRFSDSVLRPSALQNKSKQKINVFNALIACAEQAYLYGYDGTPITLYIALPPLEVGSATEEAMNAEIVGSYNVLSERLGWEVNINIGKVKVYPECYMALASFFFDFPSCAVNADHFRDFGTGYVLGIDIGASTTDFYIVQNGKPIEKSGQTIRTGCNIIEMDISNQLRARYGFDPTPEILTQAMVEGRIRMGRNYEEVGDIVKAAKQKFARTIITEIDNYFRLTNIPLPSISAIVSFGGGSIKSAYTDNNGKEIITAGCISDFIAAELTNIVDSIEVLSVEDPRTANVRGLFVRMMMDMAREAKEAQAAGITA